MIEIPLDVLRNFSDENFEDFLDDENFRYCLWAGKGWNDKEYWKLEEGLLRLIELNQDKKFQQKINNILEKIIYVYFGISSDWYSIDFENSNTQKPDFENDLCMRIERFKFLILALMTNDASLIKEKFFEYAPDKMMPYKKRSEKLDKSQNIMQITLEIFCSFQKAYYFLTELNNIFHSNHLPTMIKNPPYYLIPAPCCFFLIVAYPFMIKDEEVLEIQENIQSCKIVELNNHKGNICVYQVPLDASIFYLYISNPKSNRLFYIRLGNHRDIFDFFNQDNNIEDKKLQKILKKRGGIYFDYQNLGEKQVLNLKFYWVKYKNLFEVSAGKMDV